MPRGTSRNLEILALHYALYEAGPRKGSACAEVVERSYNSWKRLHSFYKKRVKSWQHVGVRNSQLSKHYVDPTDRGSG